MRVIRAEALGMCFGVRDALTAMESVARPDEVTVHGELVHNAEVQARIAARGFRTLAETDRHRHVPSTPLVLVTAHGISDVERIRLKQAGRQLIDTTCPLVLRAHQAARSLARDCDLIVVIGKRGHVEVQGIVEDLSSSEVVESAEEVRTYPAVRIGVLCQTTMTERTVAEVLDAIRQRNPEADVQFTDTICRPTKERQAALERLLDLVEGLVVVGGSNSNNTRALAARGRERGLPTWHVQGPEDLQPSWFIGIHVVGLTAGTSTLDKTIAAVEEALWTIGNEMPNSPFGKDDSARRSLPVIGDSLQSGDMSHPLDRGDRGETIGPVPLVRERSSL